MVSKKQKTKSLKDDRKADTSSDTEGESVELPSSELEVKSSTTSTSVNPEESESVDGRVTIDEAFITSLTLKNDMQTDQINSLLVENQSLQYKLSTLLLKVSTLLKEKEQLTIQINDLLKK